MSMVLALATASPTLTVGEWVTLAVGVAAAMPGLYLVVLAVASVRAGPRIALAVSPPRLAVVVPAHNESDLLGRCLASLKRQTYPCARYEIVVVADNCTDDTATIARESGARVLERHAPDAPGKGRALSWAFDRVLGWQPAIDMVVVVDADSVAHPGMLAGLAAHATRGAGVVQGEYLALNDAPSTRATLRAVAFLLFHRTRLGGRAALGLPCSLVGNGMLFSRAVLRDHPWRAYSSVEDLEYSVDLRVAGIRPVFARGAVVRGPLATGGKAAATQRRRWEGGRLHVTRTRLPAVTRLIARRRRWDLVDLVVDLLVPPLGVLAAAVSVGAAVAGAAFAAGPLPLWAFVPWAAALASVPLFVLLGLAAAGAPGSAYRALALAPALVAAELLVRVRLVRGLQADTWERTARPSDARHAELHEAIPGTRSASRLELGGVPIDRHSMEDALAHLRMSLRQGAFTQVCTVNTDFLVNARRDPAVMSVLRHSDLNLPDGAPVAWMGRLMGHRMPGRIAGSDLVPRLMQLAAEEGARVFLLGGEHGVAGAAADALTARISGLRIVGVHEPPYRPYEEMDHGAITDMVRNSGADILLVAFGHPKQDRWISAHRDSLGVSVAVGVGCTFDLIAGRRRRAPAWMGACGLEWLYRMVHEPGRLTRRYAADARYLLCDLLPRAIGGRVRRRTLAALGRGVD